MNPIVRILNHRAYPVFAALLLIVAAILFTIDSSGFVALDALWLALITAGLFLLWRLLVSTQTAEMDSVQKIRSQLTNSKTPTIIEFFSSYCVGCMAMKPVLDRLEQEAGERLQIIRLNIDEEPGRTLMAEYDIVFTPTFVYFDKQGNKLRDSIGILDQARVLYDLEMS